MRTLSTVFTTVIILIVISYSAESAEGGKNGGSSCLVCTGGVALIGQLAQVHNSSVSEALAKVCGLLNSHAVFKKECESLVDFAGPLLIVLLNKRFTPDVICSALDVCGQTTSGQPVCHLFPASSTEPDDVVLARTAVKMHSRQMKLDKFPAFCDWPGVSYFCNLIEKFNKIHLPVVDTDDDGFSNYEALRGYAWRGRDCDELNSNYYPGTRPVNEDIDVDSNCNGIYGVNHQTGVAYETEFCEGTEPRGVMLIGDSAGAHFHIPSQYFTASELTTDVVNHLAFALENELDWPMTSAVTGYRNITWSIVDNFTVSVYQYLRQRNLCNHRDYQNLGVNGADSGGFYEYANTIRRKQSIDYPVLVIYEFVGNDVCNMHDDTIAEMTTPEQMRVHTLRLLQKLDDVLPTGSHVLMMGLADGRYLWDSLHDRFHPLGILNKDVSYPHFYEFLSCIGRNPCNGWMTSNSTLRDFTSERASQLSDVVQKIASSSQHKYRNIDLAYIECPLIDIMKEWDQKHGPGSGYLLIEPVDGFHPNQLANILVANHLWNYLLNNQTDFIGPVNPNNGRISDIFGDQGGH